MSGCPPKEYRWKPGQSGNPLGGKIANPALKRLKALTKEEMVDIGTLVVLGNIEELKAVAKDPHSTVLKAMMAAVAIKTIARGDPGALDCLLNRLVGKVTDQVHIKTQVIDAEKKKLSFEEFCLNAGYPKPYPKQLEMQTFAFDDIEKSPRLLLGARGYGKTDYLTILGAAYEVYKTPLKTRVLIITKSKERNAAVLAEIAGACEKAGVDFEKRNALCLRVNGLFGKDNSVSAVTIGTVTLRGRHPDIIIMDDPVTEDDISEATRNRVQRVYNEAIKLTKNILLIGQTVHKYDLYEMLRPLLKKLEIVWGEIPELNHDLDAMRAAGIDESSIQASYFLKVPSEGAQPFDKIKYIDAFPPQGTSVAFIDPSFEGGDYTALTIIKAYFQGIAVVGFAHKKAWNHCIDEIALKLKKYNVARLAFETNSLGSMPIDMLRKTLPNIGVMGIKSNTNKHSRIMAAGAFSHLIHMSKESDKIYIDQVVKYEYNSKHDDAPDSLASCMSWLGLCRGAVKGK